MGVAFAKIVDGGCGEAGIEWGVLRGRVGSGPRRTIQGFYGVYFSWYDMNAQGCNITVPVISLTGIKQIKVVTIKPSPQPSAIFSPLTAGWGKMSSSNYELLSQEGAGFEETPYDRPTHSGPVRPPTYYGEGPFDPPSSEDEDETLLQKEPTRSPGTVERAGYAEPDVKVSSPPLHPPAEP